MSTNGQEFVTLCESAVNALRDLYAQLGVLRVVDEKTVDDQTRRTLRTHLSSIKAVHDLIVEEELEAHAAGRVGTDLAALSFDGIKGNEEVAQV